MKAASVLTLSPKSSVTERVFVVEHVGGGLLVLLVGMIAGAVFASIFWLMVIP